MHLKTPESEAMETLSTAGSKLFLSRGRVTYNRQSVWPGEHLHSISGHNSCHRLTTQNAVPRQRFLRRRYQP